jgi:5-hydroxyisourate hydrolase
MAKLTTHVLDTARGTPAAGLRIELWAFGEMGRHPVCITTTNADGRTDQPLLSGESIPTGVYVLSYHVAEYFRAAGVLLDDPPFLDVVVIRFGIADPEGQYHVPLLVSPYGYTTYRGS